MFYRLTRRQHPRGLQGEKTTSMTFQIIYTRIIFTLAFWTSNVLAENEKSNYLKTDVSFLGFRQFWTRVIVKRSAWVENQLFSCIRKKKKKIRRTCFRNNRLFKRVSDCFVCSIIRLFRWIQVGREIVSGNYRTDNEAFSPKRIPTIRVLHVRAWFIGYIGFSRLVLVKRRITLSPERHNTAL